MTPEQVAEVRRLWAAGVKQWEIAALVGSNQATVSLIVTGKRYRFYTDPAAKPPGWPRRK